MENKTYTPAQIKTGDYNFMDLFGFQVTHPLPFRAVGFQETDTDDVYVGTCYCSENIDGINSSVRSGWFTHKLYAVFALQADGRWFKVDSEGRL